MSLPFKNRTNFTHSSEGKPTIKQSMADKILASDHSAAGVYISLDRVATGLDWLLHTVSIYRPGWSYCSWRGGVTIAWRSSLVIC